MCVVCSCMERNKTDKLNTKRGKEGMGIITDLKFLYTFYIFFNFLFNIYIYFVIRGGGGSNKETLKKNR